MKFSELELSKEMLKAVGEMGFEEASHIQEAAIPVILAGKDMIGQAQTGTGKTAAFGIPIIERLDTKLKLPQVLVMSPTRELAIQIAEEIKKLLRYKTGIRVIPVYGGQPIERQIRALKEGVQIIIGTPGRIMDHMERRTINLSHVKFAVLDEADRMLDMGFRDDIEMILKTLSPERQTLLFSATMPSEIRQLAERFQREPEFIKVVPKELTVPTIDQYYYEVRESVKLEALCRLLDMHTFRLSIVFCNTKRAVDDLIGHLQTRGYTADALHGDMTQMQRDRVMKKFRTGAIEVLVATDVAARGIDVDDVDAVFNYDVPYDEEYYVHRIGRTGRAGRAGKAFTFISGREIYKLRDIERYAKTRINRREVPTIQSVEANRKAVFLEKVRSIMDAGELEEYARLAAELLDNEHTSLDVSAALLKMSFETAVAKPGEVATEFEDTGAAPGMVRFFLNVGRSAGLKVRDLAQFIAGELQLQVKGIGDIVIFEGFSFVEVPKENAQDMMFSLNGKKLKEVRLKIEPARPRE